MVNVKPPRLLSPAIALMNRMSFSGKFTVLALISLVAVSVTLYSLYGSLYQVVSRSQTEIDGLAIIKPLAKTVQLVQQHRGLSSGVLSGASGLQQAREARQQATDAAFSEVEQLLPPNSRQQKSWLTIKAAWEDIKTSGMRLQGSDNFNAHTQLIDELLLYEESIADDYGLTSDPDLDAYYLAYTSGNDLLRVLEYLGQIRANGTRILSARQASDQQKTELHSLITLLNHTMKALKNGMVKAAHYNPGMQTELAATVGYIEQSSYEVIDKVNSEILGNRFSMRPGEFFYFTTGAINNSYEQLYRSLLPAVEKLIQARIQRHQQTLQITIGIALLLLLLVVYFLAAIYYATLGSIRTLSQSVVGFVRGDMRGRVSLSTQDELSQVGDSFNEMAEELNALLAEKHAAADELRIAAVAFETHEAIMITDVDANIIRVNNAFKTITGYSAEEVMGKNPRILQSGLHSKAFYEEMWATILSYGSWSGELWDRHKNGHIYPKQVTITAVKSEVGKTTQYVSIFTDITERKRAEEEIHNLAFYDALTELPNRRLLLDRLGLAISLSARNLQYGALLFLDMDKFKTLNDTFGHDHGDILLTEVANRLKLCVREVDTVARLGGDEFVVLLEGMSTDVDEASQNAAQVAEKIRAVLASPYLIKDQIHHSSPSIGVCLFCGSNVSVDELIKRADMAMYQAKDTGRNKVRFFDPHMQKSVEIRANLESGLRHALTAQQLQLHYQMQLDHQRQPIGAEALLRWKHPERGMVPPAEFIPIAEESSLILDIGQWVLESACQQLAEWSANPLTRNLSIAINISAQQFKHPDFVEQVSAAINKYRIDPARLKLELTESVALDDIEVVVLKMLTLRQALGIALSLDDFGTGYSSLSYLKRLPLDQLKIDQSFVRDMTSDSSDAVMVKTIIDMAHNFGLSVIAEGVETTAQLAILNANGCSAYQGYLFSKPIPVDQFEELLKKMYTL